MLKDAVVYLDFNGTIIHDNKTLGLGGIPEGADRKQMFDEGTLPTAYYSITPDDVVFMDGALEGLRMLHEAGVICFIVTHQSWIGEGIAPEAKWDSLVRYANAKIEHAGGKIVGWAVCPHRNDEGCDCRKPSPKMLRDLQAKYEFNIRNSYMVGDNVTDILAGVKARCRATIYIPNREDEDVSLIPATYTAKNLVEAAEIILDDK